MDNKMDNKKELKETFCKLIVELTLERNVMQNKIDTTEYPEKEEDKKCILALDNVINQMFSYITNFP